MSRKAKKMGDDLDRRIRALRERPDGKPWWWTDYVTDKDGNVVPRDVYRHPPKPYTLALQQKRREMETKAAAEKARGPSTARLVHRKAEERHKRIGDYAVERALGTGSPEFYAERRGEKGDGRLLTRLAERLLAQWPEDQLGKPLSKDWLRKILSHQRVPERLREIIARR